VSDTGEKVTPVQSSLLCARDGKVRAIIRNYAEYVVAKRAGTGVLGLHRRGSEWVWDSGEKVTFERWEEGKAPTDRKFTGAMLTARGEFRGLEAGNAEYKGLCMEPGSHLTSCVSQSSQKEGACRAASQCAGLAETAGRGDCDGAAGATINVKVGGGGGKGDAMICCVDEPKPAFPIFKTVRSASIHLGSYFLFVC
jgi:hypothetical protein